jgi:two-component system NtrC family sensor kinase
MFSLNLREKVLAGLFTYLIIYLIFGCAVFADFSKFNENVLILIRSVTLGNICLEIRRYEKNYIMSGNPEDYETTKKFIGEGLDYVNTLVSDLKETAPPILLHRLQTRLEEYNRIFSDLHADPRDIRQGMQEQPGSTLRHQGKELIDLSNDLITYEQEVLKKFISEAKYPIIIALFFLLGFTSALAVFISKKLLDSLNSLQQAADTVAKGTFLPLPLPRQKDEIYGVRKAFNMMVEELEQQQQHLTQAQKLSSIGTLTSGVAHQLNNPLNNISTSCQIAIAGLEKSETADLRKMLENISQETQRAAEIVRDLLEFSREMNFMIRPANLAAVVDQVLHLAINNTPAGVTLSKDVPSDLVIDMDPQKMAEALLNLVINAIQAIPIPPGGRISISATADIHLSEATIIVADTGRGISQQHQQNIFEPFFTTKEIGQGTGLGLAVVYGIVKKHNGNIRVKSAPGEGSRFIINLPLHAGSPPSTPI